MERRRNIPQILKVSPENHIHDMACGEEPESSSDPRLTFSIPCSGSKANTMTTVTAFLSNCRPTDSKMKFGFTKDGSGADISDGPTYDQVVLHSVKASGSQIATEGIEEQGRCPSEQVPIPLSSRNLGASPASSPRQGQKEQLFQTRKLQDVNRA